MSSEPTQKEKTANSSAGRIALPDIPVLYVNAQNAALFTTDGEVLTLPHERIPVLIRGKAVMLCHAPYTKARLKFEEFFTFDILELFAFTHPAKFCVPTPAGLCKALNITPPSNFEDHPFAIIDIARTLLEDLQDDPYEQQANPADIATVMGLKGKGWPWCHYVCEALGRDYDPLAEIMSRRALNIWKHLPEWIEEPPEPPTSHENVTSKEAQDKLGELLNAGGSGSDSKEEQYNNGNISNTILHSKRKQASEASCAQCSKLPEHSETEKQRTYAKKANWYKYQTRPSQQAYCQSMRAMFEPMDEDENPHIILAEAQTGVGKTLGYLAPSSVWADKNEASVWISTYTKNLQRQINSQLDRLYPNPVVKDAYVALRKGRENYLCLLNLEEAATGAGQSHNPRHAVTAGIMARWSAATKDGDLNGSDFPGWLPGILGWANTSGLSDRRGECIYSACDHYHRCFVERSIRKSSRARLVIANHALVMINAARSTSSETMPTRYIFDEGHHLFSAADNAYASHLTARETAELRRWITGNEAAGKKSRSRGLKRRCEDLIEGDEKSIKALEDITRHASTALCTIGWSRRFKDKSPNGPCETFLMDIHRLVHARASARELDSPYSIETPLFPLDDEIIKSCRALKKALNKLLKPMDILAKRIYERLGQDQGKMDGDTRKRMDALTSSLELRGITTLKNWIAMLETMDTTQKAEGFVDWMEVERIDGKSVDVGIYRHYIDPMKPFATSMRPHVHGMAVTSATLQDSTGNAELDWQAANERSGAHYLSPEPHQSSYPSPFNYKDNARIIIINDVNKNDLKQVSSAYLSLFTAAGGGALGLFTAIQRLRAVYEQIALPLEKSNIPVYGQHIEQIDTGTLIDIFREEHNSCLLGTDAVRDGVDIPGSSLRLLVFDRTPWPRPTILHKARRKAFGDRRYDEMLTRMKLKQAFGRLIRHEEDKGIFVILDSMLPTRLQSAFPEKTPIAKISLKQAIEQIEQFLKPT